MDILLLMGSMLIAGYLAGVLATRLGFPRITGYMIAGIFMNPSVLPIFHRNTVDTLNFITPVVLGVISYMIGGGLRLDAVRKLGRAILSITIFQGLTPFLLTVFLIAGLGPYVLQIPGDGKISTFIPMALVLGAIAASSAPRSRRCGYSAQYQCHWDKCRNLPVAGNLQNIGTQSGNKKHSEEKRRQSLEYRDAENRPAEFSYGIQTQSSTDHIRDNTQNDRRDEVQRINRVPMKDGKYRWIHEDSGYHVACDTRKAQTSSQNARQVTGNQHASHQ
jgi:hypothetical protein